VLVNPKITGRKRNALLGAADRGADLEEDQARYVRVVEYEVPDREGDGNDGLIALVTTITDARLAPAQALAMATTSGGNTKAATSSSRRTCAARERCCARSPRPWWSRRSGATC
jgi:hypothetical protein